MDLFTTEYFPLFQSYLLIICKRIWYNIISLHIQHIAPCSQTLYLLIHGIIFSVNSFFVNYIRHLCLFYRWGKQYSRGYEWLTLCLFITLQIIFHTTARVMPCGRKSVYVIPWPKDSLLLFDCNINSLIWPMHASLIWPIIPFLTLISHLCSLRRLLYTSIWRIIIMDVTECLLYPSFYFEWFPCISLFIESIGST